jgi:hypothetical protein
VVERHRAQTSRTSEYDDDVPLWVIYEDALMAIVAIYREHPQEKFPIAAAIAEQALSRKGDRAD